MTRLVLDLSPEIYTRLQAEANRLGKSAQVIAQDWLIERLSLLVPTPPDERERVTEVLRAAGLLAELSPEEKQRAAQSSATLEEVRAALDRVAGCAGTMPCNWRRR